MDSFVFKELTKEDVDTYADNAYVFNKLKSEIGTEKVIVGSISDERFGSSKEVLNVAVKKGDSDWNLLDIEDRVKGYNEIPLGYVLQDIDYDKVLVIIRRMSNFAFDEKNHSATSYIYSVMKDEYKNLSLFPAVSGMLAVNRVYLDKDFESVKSDIEDRYGKDTVKTESILSGIRKILGE